MAQGRSSSAVGALCRWTQPVWTLESEAQVLARLPTPPGCLRGPITLGLWLFRGSRPLAEVCSRAWGGALEGWEDADDRWTCTEGQGSVGTASLPDGHTCPTSSGLNFSPHLVGLSGHSPSSANRYVAQYVDVFRGGGPFLQTLTPEITMSRR